MTVAAPVLIPDFLGALAEAQDADHWALARIAARLIPAHVDLDNECVVAVALLHMGMTARQTLDVLTDAIELARELRGGRRTR